VSIVLIAEIGSSPAPDWNFDLWCAAAAQAGATHVKAQMFRAEHFPDAEQAGKRPLVFPRKRFEEFVEAAHEWGLQAGASVFDAEAVGMVSRQGDFLKLAAREQYNRELLIRVFQQDQPFFRSVSDLTFGEGVSKAPVTTLFAVQSYPAPMLESILKLARFAWRCRERGYRWGWSSHTRGDLDCRLATRLGASVIEKHLCLSDDDLEAGHALRVDKFRAMARCIRGVDRNG
jgi:sialic acid synthase SpsE